ncbi:phage tail tape measure protein [Gilliamella sp. Fer4-1]|uniref:phage tail tape measure protein n=1 Tax=Gilliamella sp. Fer4-1 TaxID=3120242 RepID=UPI00080DE969|nr:phage tail tape measure protein [Gilliamella apicola]OCG64021.1 phage tail tape measure protein [Gilliamella apicola]
MTSFNLKAAKEYIDKLPPKLNNIKGKLEKFQKSVQNSKFAKFDLKGAVTGLNISAPFVKGVKDAIAYEEVMADIKKVVDFDTPEQFKQMGQDIREMSLTLPMAAKDIGAIVAAGGQAGIPKEDLKQFAEDAVKMGIAFDSSAEEASSTMATWRTALKLTQNEVVELSDKIKLLSNPQNAKAKDISDVVTNVVTEIGSLDNISGSSTDKLVALSSTIISVGTNTDQAATGIKNFMSMLASGEAATEKQQEALQQLGFTSTEIANIMQKDAEGAITSVLESLGKVPKDRQSALLADLFGKESIAAISPLVDNLELLKTNFKRVEDASQYAGLMQEQYELRLNNVAQKLQIFNNGLNNISLSIGEALLPTFIELLNQMQPLIVSFGHFIQENPELVKMAAMAIVGLIGLRVACAGVNTIVGVLTTGIDIYNGVLKANKWVTKSHAAIQLKLSNAFKKVRNSSIALKIVTLAHTGVLKSITLATKLFTFSKIALSNAFKTVRNSSIALKIVTVAYTGILKSITLATKLFAFAQIALSNAFKIVRVTSIALFTVMAMNPIGLIMTGIAIAATLIITYWDDIVKFFQWLWGVIKPYVMPIIDYFIAEFKAGGESIINGWQRVNEFFSGLWASIEPYVMLIFDIFIEPFKNAGEVIPTVWESVQNFFKNLWDNVKSGIQPLLDAWDFLFGDNEKKVKVTADTASLPKEMTKPMVTCSNYQTPQMPINNFSNNNANRNNNGELVVKFENAPQGTIVKQTKQASGFDTKADVGWNPYALGVY